MTWLVKALTLEMAEAAAEAALAKGEALGLKIAVAIMDCHGNLKVFRRMDGNNAISVTMAQRKAKTSALIPLSTKALAERNNVMEGSPYLGVPEVVLLEGGLPIFSQGGEHMGSIGVSGAMPDLDGQCAQAGLDAIVDEL